MQGHFIITIGRESGSGGAIIGKSLAEKLGISFYDHELLDIASKKSGISQEIITMHDEKPINSFLFSLYAMSSINEMPFIQKVFLAQFETIRYLASQESCVIIGRCADYILADHPNKVSIYINADDEDRIKSLKERNNIESYEKAKDFMVKNDKKRASYYNYYTDKKWGDAKNFDLCINSSRLGFEGTADAIFKYLEIRKSLSKDAVK